METQPCRAEPSRANMTRPEPSGSQLVETLGVALRREHTHPTLSAREALRENQTMDYWIAWPEVACCGLPCQFIMTAILFVALFLYFLLLSLSLNAADV